MRRVREAEAGPAPAEGLRERKKRLTRQQISDTATWMFCAAASTPSAAPTSPRRPASPRRPSSTSFPTKESLVLDREEELTAQLVDALRDRAPGTSPVDAVMAFMEREAERYRELPAEATWMLRAFDRLIRSTPALVAAQRAMTRRMVEALAAELASELGQDPLDPEPQIVAHALMGLARRR